MNIMNKTLFFARKLAISTAFTSIEFKAKMVLGQGCALLTQGSVVRTPSSAVFIHSEEFLWFESLQLVGPSSCPLNLAIHGSLRNQ